jgi:phasin family protein
MTMYVTPDQITAANKAGVETLLGLAHANFAAFEKIAALNFNATKAAFEDAISHTKAVLNVKDVQELVNLNVAAAQPSLEKAITYSRSVYEVTSGSQAELTKFLEGQANEYNRNVVGLLDKFAKNAPAGSDVAVAAVKSALAAANTAYDSMTKVAKQATEIAEANFAAATAATKDAVERKVALAPQDCSIEKGPGFARGLFHWRALNALRARKRPLRTCRPPRPRRGGGPRWRARLPPVHRARRVRCGGARRPRPCAGGCTPSDRDSAIPLRPSAA